MRKIIKLINNERINTRLLSKKAVEDNAYCKADSIDICSIIDSAACYAYANDQCNKDHAACSDESWDVCNFDCAACTTMATDYCENIDVTVCSSQESDIT